MHVVWSSSLEKKNYWAWHKILGPGGPASILEFPRVRIHSRRFPFFKIGCRIFIDCRIFIGCRIFIDWYVQSLQALHNVWFITFRLKFEWGFRLICVCVCVHFPWGNFVQLYSLLYTAGFFFLFETIFSSTILGLIDRIIVSFWFKNFNWKKNQNDRFVISLTALLSFLR